MNKFARKISILLAMVMACGSMAACGSYSGDGIAKYGSEVISAEEAEFWLRYEEWFSEAYYWDMYTYYGYDNMWDIAYTEDQTYGEYVHDMVMSEILQTRVLCDHASEYGIEGLNEDQQAKVAEAVTSIHETYPKLLEHVHCTDEQITEYMTKNAIANLVIEAVKDAAEVTVEDDECKKYAVEYILVSEPSEDEEAEETEAAEEETEEAEDKLEGLELANAILKDAEAGTAFEEISDKYDGINNSTTSYLVTGETSTAIPYTASQDMKVGEIRLSEAEGTGWYIIKKVDDFNEEATEEAREAKTEEKKTEVFNEKYVEWSKSAAEFKVNEKAWAKYTLTEKIFEMETEEEVEDMEDMEEEAEEVIEETAETAETEAQ